MLARDLFQVKEQAELVVTGLLMGEVSVGDTVYVIRPEDDYKAVIVDIDKNKIISEFDTYYFDRDSSLFIFYIDSNSKKRVLYSWLNGNKIELSKESSYEKFSNYVTVTENGKTKYYNSNLKLIYTE